MFFEPLTHKSHGLPFNPIKALIAPRPIGWLSSKGSDGSVNLAPYSFFNGVSDDPSMVILSIGTNPDGSIKDSLRNIEETGEFTVNIVGADQMDAMNISSGDYPYGENEFDVVGLKMIAGQNVTTPRVDAVPAALECTHFQTVKLPTNEAGVYYSVVFGTIVGVYIDDNVIVDGKVAYERFKPIARLGYHDYAEVSEVFAMKRPAVER